MDLDLGGRRALITGGSRGIGAAVAEVLAEEGCHLRIAARDETALRQVADRLTTAHGVEVGVHPVDLRRSEAVTELASAASDVDILINNAGDIPGGSLDDIDEQAWRHSWELKVFGYINLTRLLYARMRDRGGGVIINNIGLAGERPAFDYIAGCTGNSALMAFTRSLGGRSLRDHIRVVGVNPGPVHTDRIIGLMRHRAGREFGDESRYPELLASVPAGRAAQPREIADTVAFLASTRSAYTSGVVVTVDGGLSAAQGR